MCSGWRRVGGLERVDGEWIGWMVSGEWRGQMVILVRGRCMIRKFKNDGYGDSVYVDREEGGLGGMSISKFSLKINEIYDILHNKKKIL